MCIIDCRYVFKRRTIGGQPYSEITTNGENQYLIKQYPEKSFSLRKTINKLLFISYFYQSFQPLVLSR